jgi:hypothetical protein
VKHTHWLCRCTETARFLRSQPGVDAAHSKGSKAPMLSREKNQSKTAFEVVRCNLYTISLVVYLLRVRRSTEVTYVDQYGLLHSTLSRPVSDSLSDVCVVW